MLDRQHKTPILQARRLRWMAAACVILACFANGCVSRRITVRSNPPGALVMLEGKKVGYTPVSFDVNYYATRELTLVKPGYEMLTVMQKMRPPWYQVPPLDFVSDNFLPYKLTNRQEYSYSLNPELVHPTQEVLERGRQLRAEAQLAP